MADETKRVIDQTTDQSLSAGDFIIVDSESEGTRKFDLGTELTGIKQDLLALEQEGYPMASIQEAVDAWADENEAEIVNIYATPQMFGAKGDGVTDDSIAFIDAMSRYNKIYVPSGTYYMGRYIEIPSNCVIYGDNAVLLFDTNTNGYQTAPHRLCIVSNAKNVLINGIQFCFVGKSSAYPATDAGLLFQVNASSSIKFNNCAFIVEDNANVNNTITCMWINGSMCENVILENCTFKNLTEQVEGGALWVYGNHKNLYCINCYFIHSCTDEAIVVWGQNATSYPVMVMDGCSIEALENSSVIVSQLLQSYAYGILRFNNGIVDNKGSNSYAPFRVHDSGFLGITNSRLNLSVSGNARCFYIVSGGTLECKNCEIDYVHRGTSDTTTFIYNEGGKINISDSLITVSYTETFTARLAFFKNENVNADTTFSNNSIYIDSTNANTGGWTDFAGAVPFITNFHDNIFVNIKSENEFKWGGYGNSATHKIAYNNTLIDITSTGTSLLI